MATAAQILKTAKTVDFMFDEFTRTARQEKLKAKFRGDMATHAKIDKAWRAARDAKEESLEILEAQLLSSPVTDKILAELKGQQKKARKFLDKIRKAQDVLGTIADVANLATSTLGRIKGLL